MRHTITFGTGANTKNTWTDWGLLPVNQPIIAPPPVKTNSLELPGRSGEIDLSETVTGYPLYGNRTGQLSFLKVDRWQDYLTVKGEIMEFLHGQRTQMILSDEPSWCYEGRFSIDEYGCDELHGTLAIGYSVDPYRWALQYTTEPWKWNPFSFVDGVIYNGSYSDPVSGTVYQGAGLMMDIEVGTTPIQLAFNAQATGSAPQSVKFAASGTAVSITVMNGAAGLANVSVESGGEAVVPGLVLYRGKWLYLGVERTVYAKTASGTASLSLGFRPGRL